MARIAFGTDTTPELGDLDANFIELYDLRDKIRTAAYAAASPVVTFDSSLRAIFGHTTAVGTRVAATSVVPSVQNVGTSLATASIGSFMFESASATSAGYLFFARSRHASMGSHTVVQNGDALGRISFAGSDGTQFTEAARIEASVAAAPGTDDMPGQLRFLTTADGASSPTAALIIDVTQHTKPAADNTSSCGTAANRWSVVYAATGTINTSDARDKTPVAPLTAAEIAAARDLARAVGGFQFLHAVAAKGDAAARVHIGLTVQRAIDILRSHGLHPLRYAFICHDRWAETREPAVMGERQTGLLDSDGRPLVEHYEIQPARVIPAGDRYSLRPDELLLFIARGLEARITEIEARLDQPQGGA